MPNPAARKPSRTRRRGPARRHEGRGDPRRLGRQTGSGDSREPDRETWSRTGSQDFDLDPTAVRGTIRARRRDEARAEDADGRTRATEELPKTRARSARVECHMLRVHDRELRASLVRREQPVATGLRRGSTWIVRDGGCRSLRRSVADAFTITGLSGMSRSIAGGQRVREEEVYRSLARIARSIETEHSSKAQPPPLEKMEFRRGEPGNRREGSRAARCALMVTISS